MVWNIRPFFAQTNRNLHTSSSRCSSNVPDPKKATDIGPAASQAQEQAPRPPSRLPGGPKGTPTPLDKKYLVWSGQYKTADQIPKQLEADVIYRARSWGRIRLNLSFLLLAALGGLTMVISGKRAAARGESVEKQNLEWHRQIKEDYEREQKAKK